MKNTLVLIIAFLTSQISFANGPTFNGNDLSNSSNQGTLVLHYETNPPTYEVHLFTTAGPINEMGQFNEVQPGMYLMTSNTQSYTWFFNANSGTSESPSFSFDFPWGWDAL